MRDDTFLVPILLRNNGRPAISCERDNCWHSSESKARSRGLFFHETSHLNPASFGFQINERVVRYVARPCTLFPAVIEACRRLCCRCRMLFMRLYGKGDAGTASGDAAAALLGMHRSRHGGERRRWWRRDRARDSQPALLTSER